VVGKRSLITTDFEGDAGVRRKTHVHIEGVRPGRKGDSVMGAGTRVRKNTLGEGGGESPVFVHPRSDARERTYNFQYV